MEDEWREKGVGRNKGGIEGRKGENVRDGQRGQKRGRQGAKKVKRTERGD